MLALEDLPPPHPATTVALLGLVCALWVFLRVQILRRRLRNQPPDAEPVQAAAFLQRLAVWPGTYLLLGVLAVGFGLLLWWSWRQ